MNRTEQMVKTYRSDILHLHFTSVMHRFKKDAAKLALEGWQVQSHTYSRWINTKTVTAIYTREVEGNNNNE